MSDFLYTASEISMKNPSNKQFHLHNHNEYEIYMFLEGNTRYVVEERNYDLSPDDIIIIRKHEMHRAIHDGSKKYRRIVFMVSPDFFPKNNCAEYENAFLSKSGKIGNKINAELVHSSGLYDAIMRLKKYSNNFSNVNTSIFNSIMIEILYLINLISSFEYVDSSNVTIKKTINYLNNHFTDEVTLDELCKKFLVSKYHLCHIFKKATGLTIQQYVKQKRLTLAAELYNDGKTLSEAAFSAGFHDYSSFYRAYTEKYKTNPKNKLTHHPPVNPGIE